MNSNKPRLVKDYEKVSEAVQEQIKLVYPHGFTRHLITFLNREGQRVSALPFETDEVYYLIRMTKAEAKEIVKQDDDFDEDGVLKSDVREEYEEKYSDDTDMEDDDDDLD